MAKQKHPVPPFQSIDAAALDGVTGGRWIPRKNTDPAITNGIKGIVEAIGTAGQAMTAAKTAKSNEMQQMMQQMKGRG